MRPPHPTTLRLLSALLAALCACTVHHVETIETTTTGGGSPRQGPVLRLDVQEQIQPGGGAHGQFPDQPGVALAHPFIGRAGATVSARIEHASHDADVSIRGPITEGMSPESTTVLVRGEGRVDLPADGVYFAVVGGHAEALAGYDLHVDCHSDECRPECSQTRGCPDNSRCYFIQCVTTPCPSFCQVDLPDEPSPPVVSDPGDPCGSRGMPACEAGSFCDFPLDAGCGEVDHPGRCQRVPDTCPTAQALVCGCDGRTYANACYAHMRGISVRSEGACAGSPTPEPVPERAGGGSQRATGPGCMRTGCSSQICTEVGNDRTTTCEMRPEYACLRQARCERQADGECDWTRTPEFEACVADL